MCLCECGWFLSCLSEKLLTVELAAHHRDLERLEVALHEGLTVVASMGPGSIVAEYLDIGSVPGQYCLLDVDQEAHEVLFVGRFGKCGLGLQCIAVSTSKIGTWAAQIVRFRSIP